MRNLKKTLAILLSMVMVLGLVTLPALAAKPAYVTKIEVKGTELDGDQYDAAITSAGADVFKGAVAAGGLVIELPDTHEVKALAVGTTTFTAANLVVAAVDTSITFEVWKKATTDPEVAESKEDDFKINVKAVPAQTDNGGLDIGTEKLIINKPDADVTYWRFCKGNDFKGKWNTVAAADYNAKDNDDNDVAVIDVSKVLKVKGAFEIINTGTAPGNGAVDGVQRIYVEARATKPNKVEIAGFRGEDDDMVAFFKDDLKDLEFRPLNRGWWEPCEVGASETSAPVRAGAQTYQFRVKAIEADGLTADTGMTPGSPAVNAKVPAFTKSPAVKIDYAKGIVKANVKWEIWDSAKGDKGGEWVTSVKDFKMVAEFTEDQSVEKGFLVMGGDYAIRVTATENKKPASRTVYFELQEAVDAELIGDAAELYFAQNAKGGLVPAQGALLEHWNGTKWAKGLPRAAFATATEIRVAGTATTPPSASVWGTYSTTGVLLLADNEDMTAPETIDFSGGIANRNPSISPTEANYNLANKAAVTFFVNLGSGTLAATGIASIEKVVAGDDNVPLESPEYTTSGGHPVQINIGSSAYLEEELTTAGESIELLIRFTGTDYTVTVTITAVSGATEPDPDPDIAIVDGVIAALTTTALKPDAIPEGTAWDVDDAKTAIEAKANALKGETTLTFDWGTFDPGDETEDDSESGSIIVTITVKKGVVEKLTAALEIVLEYVED